MYESLDRVVDSSYGFYNVDIKIHIIVNFTDLVGLGALKLSRSGLIM